MSIELMTAAWKTNLPTIKKMVLLALCDNSNDQGECYPSICTLAEKCSMNERTVQRSIAELEIAGYVVREMRAARSTIYRVNPGHCATLPPAQSHPGAVSPRHSVTPALCHPTPAQSHPYPGSVPPYPGTQPPIIITQSSINRHLTVKAENADLTAKPKNGFDLFWSAYPKKVSKGNAIKSWNKLNPSEHLLGRILAAVKFATTSKQWIRDAGQYIPYPAAWLNVEGWLDELDAAAYDDRAVEVFDAYNATLTERGWPQAVMSPYSRERDGAIREFLAFGTKPEWVIKYFCWLGDNLTPRPGYGFDWVIQIETYLRAKEGNYKALQEAA